MGKHALLSPSGASRWLVCTPSARFEEDFENRSSAASEEGTVAHELGEILIAKAVGQITEAEFQAKFKNIQLSDYYNGEMLEHCEGYRDFVVEKFYEAKSHTSDARIYLEQELDLSAFAPESFGTGDVGIVADGRLTGIDLKYGKGVRVEAKDNKQLKIYALGFYERFKFLYDIQEVAMYIYQPRIDNIEGFIISVDELLEWSENELKPKAELAFKGEGEHVPGPHCKFCKAKAVCRAKAEHATRILELKNKAQLTDAEIADILTNAKEYKNWVESVEEHALREAIAGNKHWPGYKLVEGRSIRKINDTVEAATRLTRLGIIDIYKPQELRSLTDLEKAVGKKKFAEVMVGIIDKPRGAPTLAPESDKRPAYNSAELDFEND